MRYAFLLAVYLGALPLAAQPSSIALAPPDPVADGYFGKTVASVPDADGDGHEDLLIGAANDNPDGARRAYLYSGATGSLLFAFDSPDANLQFGYPVAGVPDTDGDGRGDLLIGASNTSIPNADFGRAYLFSGATGALLHTLEPPAPESDNDSFGYAVAGVPDTDGDGRGDLLVGVSTDSDGRSTAYLFSGATGSLLLSVPDPIEPPANNAFGLFGLAGVPDTNGDGRGDFLVSSFFLETSYLFSGATGALLHTLTSPTGQGFFGATATGLSDLDSDGYGDLFIGAFYEDGEFFAEGRAYIFSGNSGTLLHALAPPSPQQEIYFGRSGSTLPDVDGDGRPDLAIGSWTEGDPSGRVHLFSGISGSLIRTFSSPGVQTGSSRFGTAVAGVRDAQGGGKILVGAPREANGSGSAYLLSDLLATPSEAGPLADARITLHAPAPNPASGTLSLTFDLPEPGELRLDLYDLLGRRVSGIVRGTYAAGSHTVAWNSEAVSEGLYLVRLSTGSEVRTRRITKIR